MKADNTHILLTGGAGYIGSHVYYALLGHGFYPVVIDNLSTGLRENFPADAIFYEKDINDYEAVSAILKKHGIDSIMHFAGSTDVIESFADPEKYRKNNVEASKTLLKAAVDNNVRHFVFSSSAAVYGVPEKLPVSETMEAKPVSPYGESKLVFENILKNSDLSYAALRYFNVAGADPKGRTGPTGKGPIHVIKAAVAHYLGQTPEFKIFGNDYDTPDGTCIRDFIHVSDLAEIHVLALKYLQKEQRPLTINCGYGYGISIKSLADALSGLPDAENIRIEYGPRRAGDVPAIYADISTLKKTLAWSPSYEGVKSMIKSEIDWELKKASNRESKKAVKR